MIIVDIETSGLDPTEHGLLSIAAVNFLDPKDAFYGECRVLSKEKADSAALELNGITKEEARSMSRQHPKALLKSFDTWLEAHNVKVIGGMHMAAFDIPFLAAKAMQYDVPLRLHRRSIDLHSLAYAKMLSLKRIIPLTDGWSVMDTDTIFPFCGLPVEPTPKNSLNGVKWEAECFSRLIYGKGIFKIFEKYPVPTYLKR